MVSSCLREGMAEGAGGLSADVVDGVAAVVVRKASRLGELGCLVGSWFPIFVGSAGCRVGGVFSGVPAVSRCVCVCRGVCGDWSLDVDDFVCLGVSAVGSTLVLGVLWWGLSALSW